MGYSYLVLGTGMGRAIADGLLRQEDTAKVTIGDIDPARAGKLAGNLSAKYGRPCEGDYFDAEDPDSLKRMGDFDVIISALPARHNLGLAERAVERGIHFCDLGGVLSVTLAMRDLNEKALSKNLSVVPDCGLMPGLGIMVARKLVNDSITAAPESSYRDVLIYVGGLPQKPKPPMYYQRMFSLEGLKHLCYDDAPILNEGRVVFVPPFTGHSYLTVKELAPFSPEENGAKDGLVETFITAGASLAPWSFRKLGVSSLSEMTIRWPGFVSMVSAIEEADFEETIGPMIDTPVNAENPDLVWMKVIVSYKGEGDKDHNSHTLFAVYDPVSRLTAMEQTTGFTTALIAQAIARGETKPGVFTPDEALIGNSLNRVITETGSCFQVTEE